MRRCVHACVCTCVCVYVSARACAWAHARTRACTRVRMRAFVRLCTHVCVCVLAVVCARVRVCVYVLMGGIVGWQLGGHVRVCTRTRVHACVLLDHLSYVGYQPDLRPDTACALLQNKR